MACVSCSGTYGMVEFFSRGFEISQAMTLIFLNDETSGVS